MRPAKIKRSQWYRYNFQFMMEHFLGYENHNKIFGSRRRKLFSDITSHLENDRDSLEILPVPEIDAANWEEGYREIGMKQVLPFVMRKAASDWPCCKNWSLDYFQENYGHQEVMMTDNVGLVDPESPQKFEKLRLGEYIDCLRRGEVKYLKFSRIMDEQSDLKEDFNNEWLRKFKRPTSMTEKFYMFMGPAGSFTPVHNGFSQSLFIQVTGKKRWMFWKPEDRIFLDSRATRQSFFFSQANPHKLDDPDFPLLKFAKRYDVTLEAGDIMFFPTLIWHQVENLTPNIGVAYKYDDIPGAFNSSKMMTLLYFLQTKPNLITTMLGHKKKKDYIYFRSRSDVGPKSPASTSNS